MTSYDTWEGLTTAAQQKCVRILDKDIAPVAKEIVRRHILSDIYESYTPKENGWVNARGERATYQRRYSLTKRGSVYHKFISKDEIIITSNAPASTPIVKGWRFRNKTGGFLEMLELGDMGIWRGGFPRPAIGNAQKEINKSPQIKALIKAGLNEF